MTTAADRAPVRLAAVSIDLDEVACYAAIHGLSAPDPEAAHAIYRRALPRFEALLDALGIRATFFAIGADLSDPQAAASIARLREAGHEIGNHSQDHRYDFSRGDEQEIDAQVRLAADAIERSCGTRPVGFRAPGYTVTDRVLASVAGQGYLYDTSVFPSPGYYAAKAAAIGLVRARGRRSHSIVDTPRVLLAPADPYRVGTPFHQRGGGVLELPVGVTRDATGRMPYIGTFLSLLGARRLTRAIIGRPLVNLELHGIDLSDADADGLSFLQPHQPDLRVPLSRREQQLQTAIELLRDAGYRFVTLAEAAAHFA